MILITLVIVSAYARPNNGEQLSNETHSSSSSSSEIQRTATDTASCRVAPAEQRITCSHIYENVGEFVANYINSNAVSTRVHSYLLHLFVRGKVKILPTSVDFKSDVGTTDKDGGYKQN
jgi:hypothetical protein